ncbi:glycosyltransferase [Photobacterium carnosum]|uniref:glycosyltransferase n=1 Tax=Photobacterium carnosum TaxID=2023717 RepID=UPI001E57EDCE|nr:glycosyltransferase [Photobacterium carnosum]MCD9535867.1 glycosyltransferase [Photobacterium carnosum]MCF2161229.1 glycosyltransferase [Photobacterium carnosum]
MKILYITTGLGLGGAETQVCNLCDQFIELGHDVSLAYLLEPQVITPQSDQVSIYPLGLTRSPLSLFGTFYRLVKLIKKLQPDVIHTHMVHANLIARIASIFAKTPVLISTAHNANEGSKLRMLAYRLTNPLANMTTNVSQKAVEAFIEQGAATANTIDMVPNGINTDQFSSNKQLQAQVKETFGVMENERIVLAVGRNDPAKDYTNLLEAIALLPQNNIAKFFVVGLNVEDLAPLAKELGISDRVSFLGLRRDISDLMAAADIFIMSSAWEGLPIVIGEAMASECAVITTDAGGAAQWLPNRDYIVPIKNASALSQGLNRLIHLSETELGNIGRQNRDYIIEHFSLKSVTQTWLNIYNKFL